MMSICAEHLAGSLSASAAFQQLDEEGANASGCHSLDLHVLSLSGRGLPNAKTSDATRLRVATVPPVAPVPSLRPVSPWPRNKKP